MATETRSGGPVRRTVSRTGFAVRAALGRRDGFAAFAATTVGYLLAYLYGVGHLAFGGDGEVGVLVVADPLSRLFQRSLGHLSFEPVALVEFGVGTYLFSLNTLLGLAIAALVGVNLAVTYLAWRRPKACGVGASEASTGLLAGIPALLSGAACCGPVVLVVLGIQASGALLTAFQWLIPVAVVLLVGSLLWVARSVDPAAV
ncbi:hypothetical protein [Halorussus caseinilyticus]|uniref:Uncharacterized protein n=1 Tax=Halorussus caseinilyticus TaxID=3034025 RepID=A0ABD5WPK0_9EURY|nr:hypothetical protein [Halorussus sp. DT72]